MKKKMLLITHGFPFGESERGFISTEFTELADNFDIDILAYGTNGKIKYPINNEQNINIKTFNYHKGNPINIISQIFRKDVKKDIKRAIKHCSFTLSTHRIKRILSYSYSSSLLQSEIEKIVKRDGIDIIYTYWGSEELVAALRLKEKYKDIKVITRFHGYDLYIERNEMGWQPFQQYKADYCDRVFFISNAGKKYFTKRWGGKNKSHISYLGTPAMRRMITSTSEDLILISCSNLIGLKRVERIIQTLAVLPKDIKVYWHHVGDGPEKNKLCQMAKKLLSSKENVKWKFWGYIPNKDIERVFHTIKAQLFITISSSEGLPVSVQEAFAMGIPAIGTDVGGMRELIVDNETGFLLQSDPNNGEIIKAIKMFHDMSEIERKKMSDKAYRLWNKNFDAKKNAKNFVKILKSL